MAEFMHLVGAEDVRAAASRMSDAADRMNAAASAIDDALFRDRRLRDEQLQRFEVLVERLEKIGRIG